MSSRAPSLTARLAALFALASSGLLLALGTAIYVASDRHFIEQDAHDLHGRAQIVANLIARYDPAALPEALDAVLVSHHELAVVLLDGQDRPLYARSPEVFTAAQNALPPSRGDRPGHAGHPDQLATFVLAGQGWRSYTLPHAGNGPVRQIWLAIGINHHLDFLASLLRWLIFGGGATALLSGALGVWVARRGLSPLQKISANATLISAQRLSERLDPTHLPRELLPLVSELNAMLARLEDAFRRLTDFSSDIAHELRTPISNLVTQTEVALTRARSADEYREVLGSNLEEFGRLARMIADMLFLARADHGLVTPERRPIELGREVDQLLSFYEALAEERRLNLQRDGEARALGDALMLRRAISNLLANAIRHARADSAIVITLTTVGGAAQVEVSNLGPPIPAEHLPRLFDRFYRVDPSRQHLEENTGLGLAIVKSIVEAHRGTLAVTSDGGGTRFTITLPGNPDAA